MGMTFSTLHLLGIEREALTPYLAPGDLLREQNAPWLSLVPADGPEHIETLERLKKLAKRLTKEREGSAALVFFYFDDERFVCELIRDGKKKAGCQSNEPWAKLGKELNALFADELPGKALRYASRCFSLEEQLRLLEETVGTALYDIPEEEPRRVPRGDTVQREIKAREAALRKRPDRYVLTELPREEWPESVRAKRQLYELLRPQWNYYNASWLLYEIGKRGAFVVPHHPSRIVYPYTDKEAHTDHLILYDGASGEMADWSFPGTIPRWALWRTKDGALVCLFAEIEREIVRGSRWSRTGGRTYVRCLAPDGSERWRFAPELNEHQHLTPVSTSADGIVTLFAPAIDGQIKADAQIFRLDGETGRLLAARQVPVQEGMFRLVAVEALGAFVYDAMFKKELVLLDGALQEIARWPQRGRTVVPSDKSICGAVLWYDSYFSDPRAVELYDLKTGGYETLRLEVPALLLKRLEDGRMLGINEKQTLMTVFDPDGKVAARCHVGPIGGVWQEADRTCVVELRGPDSYGLVSPETLDAMSVHVWRLDPV